MRRMLTDSMTATRFETVSKIQTLLWSEKGDLGRRPKCAALGASFLGTSEETIEIMRSMGHDSIRSGESSE